MTTVVLSMAHTPGASSIAALLITTLVLYLLHRGRLFLSSKGHEQRQPPAPREKILSRRLQTKMEERMKRYKDMYYKLQNLEEFPEVLPEARQMLQSLLEQGLLMARYKPRARSIRSMKDFDPEALRKFLEAEQADVLHEFESYVQRREAGGDRELCKTFEDARQYLVNSAPWNYTDGAWLSRTHQITTPFALRTVTKNAWQIFSEELGDGDMEKNHIVLYRELLHSIGVDLPDGDSADFLDPRHGMGDESVWRYAIGQLLISIFPNDFLPEILGFNLHYEAPALSGYKANREFPELGISPYYYALHISIDNADSGHSAMALGNIINFMEVVRETGLMDYENAWKRVQAGYLFGQSLDDNETVDHYEEKLVEFLHRKGDLARKIHCTSRARIGGRSLSSWFSEPQPDNGRKSEQEKGDNVEDWKDEFIVALADSKPWVYRGDSKKSLLMRELAWKGRMFGAFTHNEVEIMSTWIDSLKATKIADPKEVYWALVGGYENVEKKFDVRRRDVAVTHPVFPPMQEWSPSTVGHFSPRPPLNIAPDQANLGSLWPLWFAHTCLLENMISSPHQTIRPLASTCLQILRAEKGYQPEGTGIACMDEQLSPSYSPDLIALGLSMLQRQKIPEPSCLGDIVGAQDNEDLTGAAKFALTLLSWAQRPRKNGGFLLGLSRAFLDLEVWVAGNDRLLGGKERTALWSVTERKAARYESCLNHLRGDGLKCREFVGGYEHGRDQIEKFLG
ncbi:hypothetical protein PFICI_10847 [Pestalotiopsis fici W106-1]|uniref:Uncharacterized protein n=1 Tax=Pestalotiopsis fici (strain W106-1 / CGMCC3.15140) TaxID=1229662 RepID=W3WSX0_PESFW|nr:uncharacterized protein PFICI_10847 [Pestalotiopsis fici W106-1]ETS76973.1 hypothetical protein PFICI_10847 [Pestalotiopsis fici W106-1]